MKVHALVVALTLLSPCAAVAVVRRSSSVGFGPQNCVQLSRSEAGSCVLSTDCEGSDLSKTEFAFNCVGQGGGIVRHSFGVGGFEADEEFDTDVKCDRCDAPAPMEVVAKPKVQKAEPAKKSSPPPAQPQAQTKVEVVPNNIPGAAIFKAKQRASAAAATVATAQASFWPGSYWDMSKAGNLGTDVVRYGPNDCVSTYKSKEGHCIMQTNCKKADIANYEFGLVCVDKTGSPVRHLFGKDSFDAEETFDTLVKCDQCLGLEDIPDSIALNGEVAGMAKDISNLKDVLKNISTNVQMLNAKVFPAPPAPAPAPGPAVAKSAAPAAAALVHHRTHHRHVHKKRNLRHSHKRHHHRRHEDDDDDDDDDDYDEDRRSEGPAQKVEEVAPAVVAPAQANLVEQYAAQLLNTQSQEQDDDDDDEYDDRD